MSHSKQNENPRITVNCAQRNSGISPEPQLTNFAVSIVNLPWKNGEGAVKTGSWGHLPLNLFLSRCIRLQPMWSIPEINRGRAGSENGSVHDGFELCSTASLPSRYFVCLFLSLKLSPIKAKSSPQACLHWKEMSALPDGIAVFCSAGRTDEQNYEQRTSRHTCAEDCGSVVWACKYMLGPVWKFGSFANWTPSLQSVRRNIRCS